MRQVVREEEEEEEEGEEEEEEEENGETSPAKKEWVLARGVVGGGVGEVEEGRSHASNLVLFRSNF
jgi:hypothetical protein